VISNLEHVCFLYQIRISELFMLSERTYTFEQIYKDTYLHPYKTGVAVKINFYSFVHATL
jgi:hypothetical protein